jgi:hypothetical protein
MTSGVTVADQKQQLPDEAAKRMQRKRSIAIALGLGLLVALFYAATIVHLGANVMNRPI